MDDDRNAPSVLKVPRPNAIVSRASVSQVTKAIEKFWRTKAYGQPEKVRNLEALQDALSSWQYKAPNARAVGIASVGNDTLIYDETFTLPGSVDFIKELSSDIDGRVVAGICETHSGCYGLIVCDKGKVLRHFNDEDGKITANAGRLPDEVNKLEDDSFGRVETIWQKLVPTREVTNAEVHVFSKESLSKDLEQWELNRKNLKALVKAGDEFAAAHKYKEAISKYETALNVAYGVAAEDRADFKAMDLSDELHRKIDECELKLAMNASSDAAGVLRAPKPSAIVMECSTADACNAVAKATQTREYEAPQQVADLGGMAKAFSNCEDKVWATPTYWLGFARAENRTIILDPQLLIPFNEKFIRAMSKESKGRVVSGVIRNDVLSLIVCDKGQVVRGFLSNGGKVLTDQGVLPDERPKLSASPKQSFQKQWAKLVPPAEMTNFEVHVFSQEPTTFYVLRKAGGSKHFCESLPGTVSGSGYMIPMSDTLSESLADFVVSGDKYAQKRDYKNAEWMYSNALMTAERLQEKFPDDSKLAALVKEVESKSRDCKARIAK